MQVTGEYEKAILKFESPYFSFELTGKDIPQKSNEKYPATYKFCCFENHDNEYESFPEFPYLFDTQIYDVFVSIEGKYSSDVNTFEIRHEFLKDVVKKKNSTVYTGHIDFKNAVGLSDFDFYINGKLYGTLTVEVFPSKMDYQKDYYQMISDINEELYNLTFDYLKKTYLNVKTVDTQNQSLAEYLSILKFVFDDFESAFKRIERAPHHKVRQESVLRPYHKIKRNSNETRKWMLNNASDVIESEGVYLPARALSAVKHTTYNTYENQFIKFALNQISKKLEKVIIAESANKDSLYSTKMNHLCLTLKSYLLRVKAMLKSKFLVDVSDYAMRNSHSLVFAMADGYKQVYRSHLLLMKGLSLESDLLKISMKDVAELYEYWCFIAINRILRRHYTLVNTDFLKIDYSGIRVTLKKGKESKVIYMKPESGETFEVYYNRTFQDGAVNQKPDHVIVIEKKNPDIKYHFIFDAKYKVDYAIPNTPYHASYYTPGPKEEDINTMHRYRDAIVYENKQNQIIQGYEKQTYGAYVLFPYDDEAEFSKHQFYKSIEKYNVGAFPMLPSHNRLFEDFLLGIIEESSVASFARRQPLVGETQVFAENWLEPRDILIGTMSSFDQLELALEHQIYHMPLRAFTSKKLSSPESIKTIALIQSKSKFPNDSGVKYYARVRNFEIVKRVDLSVFPFVEGSRDPLEEYVKFSVEPWNKRKEKIRIEEDSNRKFEDFWMLTTSFLFNEADISDDLKISELDTLALWKEFKRIGIFSDNGKITESIEHTVQYFGCEISIKNNFISVIRGNETLFEQSIEYLRCHRHESLKGIIKGLKYWK